MCVCGFRMFCCLLFLRFFFFKQKTAYEMRISDWSSDVCSSDLLAGANGILVNITAGADFTMAEFDEVGRTVENFGSEDATIVIGTVLDPDMQDEVRVTVRSEEHTSELQSLMRISYAVFCLKKKTHQQHRNNIHLNNTKTQD